MNCICLFNFSLIKNKVLFAFPLLKSKIKFLTIDVLKIIVTLNSYINTATQKPLILWADSFILHRLKWTQSTALLSSLNFLVWHLHEIKNTTRRESRSLLVLTFLFITAFFFFFPFMRGSYVFVRMGRNFRNWVLLSFFLMSGYIFFSLRIISRRNLENWINHHIKIWFLLPKVCIDRFIHAVESSWSDFID